MTEEWWCDRCPHVAVSFGALAQHTLSHLGPDVSSTSVKLREALAANQDLAFDRAKAVIEIDRLKRNLDDVRHEWVKDVDALIEARQEIEQQAIRIEQLGGDSRAYSH